MEPSRFRTFFSFGCVSAATAVAAGAFGAHSLKISLQPEMLAVFETAVRYQMYHSFALLATGLASMFAEAVDLTWIKRAGWCFALGIVLFSGSLYAMTLTGITVLGAITPLGGLAFIAGWLSLAWAVWKKR